MAARAWPARMAGGTLALHLCGNLRHFIGAVLGGSGYVRNRELEFSLRGVSRRDLLAQVAAAKSEVMAALAHVGDEDDEARVFPLEYGGAMVAVDVFLLHLLSHLAFHLGQVDYHRRAATAGARRRQTPSPPRRWWTLRPREDLDVER